MDRIIGEWQKFMSFIGNIVAAQTAKVIGRYNQSVYEQQAAYAKQQSVMREKVYNTWEKPKLLEDQATFLAEQRVNIFKSGAELREGETGYLVLLKNMQNLSRQVAISDYNKEVERIDLVNNSLLLQARGRGEKLKGEMTAQAEYWKAGASLLTMGYASHDAGRLVIT